ncbi:MAG: ribose-phosphate pyrophosphokinase [Deltaproteobacteria bacterium]|nr:ribose-phosphate pyrophosphokinase [Deltaproteobacteria bacterium]MBW2307116.1 ribose-phosphate pyrophosphokinase [Deltaproteobacteria bacterium]
MAGTLRIFSGNANIPMAQEICDTLNITLGKLVIRTFSDGEIFVEIHESVRGMDVFVIQPTCPPVNDNIMELLIMFDALKRASAARITAVVPYYGYARQDRKVSPRVPISAKLMADLITTAGANRMLFIDLHAGQIQGFFNIPVDHLFATPVLLEYIRKEWADNLIMVSPDAGGVERTRAFAKRLNVEMAIIDKRRETPNEAEAMNIIGLVKGRNVLILDDIIDTAGTITEAAKALLENGAHRVLACCTHPVLSGPAIQRIENSPIECVVVTNTIPISKEALACKKIVVLSIAPLLAKAINSIHNEGSVSSLFV